MAGLEEIYKTIKKQGDKIEELERLLDNARVNPTSLFGDGFMRNRTLPKDVQSNLDAFIPTGGIIIWAASDPGVHTVKTSPVGFLLCNGTAYANKKYPRLAACVFDTYGRGTGKTFIANATTDVITSAGHGYSNDDVVYLTSDGTLPAGLTFGKLYYVINATTDTFKLSENVSGSAINITDTGVSTHYVYSTFLVPNISGRFPLGLKTLDVEYPIMGDTGGEKTHTLTIDEMPSHHHGTTNQNRGLMSSAGAYTFAAGTFGIENLTDTGGGQAHNNLPPYLVVSYIIKT